MSYTRNMNPWVDGQILKAEHMNHIEAAIEDLYDNFNEDTYTMNLVEKGKMIDNYIELPGGTTGAGDAYWKQGNINSGGDWDEGQSPYFVISQNYYDATRIENIIVSQYQGIDYADQYVASSTNWLYVYGYSGLPYNEEQAISYYLGKSDRPIDAYGQDTAISLSSLFNTVPKYIRFSINKKIATNISATQRTLVADLTTDLETKINNLETYLTGELSSLDTSLNSSLASSVTQLTSQITSLESSLSSFKEETVVNEENLKNTLQEEYTRYSEAMIAPEETTFMQGDNTSYFTFSPFESFSKNYYIFSNTKVNSISSSTSSISYTSADNITIALFTIPYENFRIKGRYMKVLVVDQLVDSLDTSLKCIEEIVNVATPELRDNIIINYPKGTAILLQYNTLYNFYEDETKPGLLLYNTQVYSIPQLYLNNVQDSFQKQIDLSNNTLSTDGNTLLNITTLNNTRLPSSGGYLIMSTDSYIVSYFQVPVKELTIQTTNIRGYVVLPISHLNNYFDRTMIVKSYYSNSNFTETFTARYGEWVYISAYNQDSIDIKTNLVYSSFQLPNLNFTTSQINSITDPINSQIINISNELETLNSEELTSINNIVEIHDKCLFGGDEYEIITPSDWWSEVGAYTGSGISAIENDSTSYIRTRLIYIGNINSIINNSSTSVYIALYNNDGTIIKRLADISAGATLTCSGDDFNTYYYAKLSTPKNSAWTNENYSFIIDPKKTVSKQITAEQVSKNYATKTAVEDLEDDFNSFKNDINSTLADGAVSKTEYLSGRIVTNEYNDNSSWSNGKLLNGIFYSYPGVDGNGSTVQAASYVSPFISTEHLYLITNNAILTDTSDVRKNGIWINYYNDDAEDGSGFTGVFKNVTPNTSYTTLQDYPYMRFYTINFDKIMPDIVWEEYTSFYKQLSNINTDIIEMNNDFLLHTLKYSSLPAAPPKTKKHQTFCGLTLLVLF